MTRGKYAARADTRLKVLESEALREATAKIETLTEQVKAARRECNTLRAEVDSRALRAAAALSQREKQHLRNRIASLEHKDAENRMRYAVLVWEILHRRILKSPAPARMDPDDDPRESYDLWLTVHWEIAALFFDYNETWEFFKAVEGQEWGVAGEQISIRSGALPVKMTARENTRSMKRTSNPFGGLLSRRLRRMKDYLNAVWAWHQSDKSGSPVAIAYFGENGPEHLATDEVLESWRA